MIRYGETLFKKLRKVQGIRQALEVKKYQEIRKKEQFHYIEK